MKRRAFLKAAAASAAGAAFAEAARSPNLVFVFADQWRAQATGYAGDPNVRTPHLDALSRESVHCSNAISGCSVCSPYRGSLLTGQYPHTHGVFVNDVPLSNRVESFAHALNHAGYHTGYIGKWHLDGRGRSTYIPPERRQGFEFWRTMECTHDYNKSYYYADDPTKRLWDGYDAIAQTREAQQYIRDRVKSGPFALFLSWGPPHDPYDTAPPEYRAMYDPARLILRPNVPREHDRRSRMNAAGYYAHCTALDACVGELLKTVDDCGIADDTIFVFTSDHGDMLGSQGHTHKQRPWDESIRVPFLLRHPRAFGRRPRSTEMLLNTVDLMPTLLTLCGVPIPNSVEGRSRADDLLRTETDEEDAALLACYVPFGQYTRAKGGREYRGLRTKRYTYVRSLEGPWLLYDNEADPYQLENLCNVVGHEKLVKWLDGLLTERLMEANDAFRPARDYIAAWGYKTDNDGTVAYTP